MSPDDRTALPLARVYGLLLELAAEQPEPPACPRCGGPMYEQETPDGRIVMRCFWCEHETEAPNGR